MPDTPELRWMHRSTRDSEFATARVKGFEVQVQDCDGDFSRWHIKRGDQYIVMGECGGFSPYHMDAAVTVATVAWRQVWAAVEMNDFVAKELPRLEAVGLA